MTRRIILTALAVYFGGLVLGLVAVGLKGVVLNLLFLHAVDMLHGQVWQLLSYPFAGQGLLGVAFALLSVWFFGSTLEEERGGRWLLEFFLASTVGGALVASLLVVVSGQLLGGADAVDAGMWPFVLALVVAFAAMHPEQELRFNFIFTLKAKYLAAIYVLVYVALALGGGDRFGAVVALACAGGGYGFLRWVPRRGVRAAVSEWWFGIRNSYYRAKRRRAAKKFTVYMKKQGKDVSLDAEGRYVDPMGKAHDPGDRKWMN
jgi:membrane associated rhomboid family serine protease